MNPRGIFFILLLAAAGIGTWFAVRKDPTPQATTSSTTHGTRVPLRPIPHTLAPLFSGTRAYQHVKSLYALGPRPPASPGYEKALAYLETEFRKIGWSTTRQSFTATTPKGEVRFTNLIARFGPTPPDLSTSTSTLIGGHLDSKPITEFPFIGANDGLSSTGVILELARVLATQPTAAAQTEFILFDGEEAFLPNITATDGLYGSKYYARQLSKRTTWPSLGIVIDLIGDHRVPFYYNPEASRPIVDAALAAAREFQLDLRAPYGSIVDDHVPLQHTGLPCLHLIGDFMQMPYWHQPGDTLDVISPQALDTTGKVVLRFLSTPF